MSATCHFWVISESDLRVKNKHPLKFKNRCHMKKSSAPKARENFGFLDYSKAETDEKNKRHMSKNKGHINKKGTPPEIQNPKRR